MLHVTAEVIRQVAILVQPVMPALGGEAARPARRAGRTRAASRASVRPDGCTAGHEAAGARARSSRAMSRTPRPAARRRAEPGSHARRQPLPPRLPGLRRGPRRGPRSRARGWRRDHASRSRRGSRASPSCGDRRAHPRSAARSARTRTMPHEEPDVTAEDLVRLAADPKVVAIGEAGLDYHYDNSPARGAAAVASSATSPRRARRSCRSSSTPATPTRTSATSSRPRAGKGAFPPSSTASRPGGTCPARRRARPLRLVLRHPHLQERSDELREIARDVPLDRLLVETDAPLPRAGAASGQAQRAGLCG